jgi:tetratricopeptide (TPR) repeat protein
VKVPPRFSLPGQPCWSFALGARFAVHIPHCVRLAFGAAVLVAAVAGCSRSAQSHLDRGDAYLEARKVDAAVLEFRRAVQKDAMFAPARLKLADAYLRQGNGAGALAESVRAADLLPDDENAQLKAGALLLVAGRAQDALARADRALAMAPRNADALVLRANVLAALDDLDGAILQMQQAIVVDPAGERQANLGILLHAKGRREEAEAAFRTAVATDTRSVAAQVALAKFLSGTDRPAEAEAAFKAALALDAANVEANRALATFYMASDRPAEAEPYFTKVADASGDPAAWLALADYYVTVRRNADALAMLEQLSAAPRTWALARSRLAALLYSEGKTAEAHRTIDEVIAKQPAYSEARVIRGRLLLAEGKAGEAVVEAQEAVRSDPRNADAHLLLGSARKATRDVEGAAAAFNDVLRLNPRATTAQVQLAGIHLQRGEYAKAARLAEQAVRSEPRSLEARLVLTRSLLAGSELERASTAIRELQTMFPEVGAAHAQAGLLAMRRGNRSGARATFEKALALDPRLIEPLGALTALDVGEGRAGRARARIEARLQETPHDGAVLVLAARTWASTGDEATAEDFLRRAIDADATNFDAYELLGRLYVSQNRLEEAVGEYDRLAARQPGAVGPPTMAGLILQAQGKEEAARQRYERLVESEPRAAVASNNLAWMYASRGEQLDRALQLAQAAKAALPEHPDVSDTLALVYIRKQLGSLAIPLLREAVEQRPGEPMFHYHLGLAYSQAGDKGAARQALEQALKLRDDFEGADEARTLLRSLD